MKRGRAVIHAAVGLILTITAADAAENVDERVAASRETVKAFAGALQSELKQALKDQGPVAAIAVCKIKAPEIAASQSAAHGWTVGRTSDRPRNPDNAPDAWEAAVLATFAERKAGGEDPQVIEYWETVDAGGKQQFRYMKAIPTADVCVTCHGADLAADVEAGLDALYPEDKARGYAVGDIRGAFTIIQPM